MCKFKNMKRVYWGYNEPNQMYLLDEKLNCHYKVFVFQEIVDSHCNKFQNEIFFNESESKEIVNKICNTSEYLNSSDVIELDKQPLEVIV